MAKALPANTRNEQQGDSKSPPLTAYGDLEYLHSQSNRLCIIQTLLQSSQVTIITNTNEAQSTLIEFQTGHIHLHSSMALRLSLQKEVQELRLLGKPCRTSNNASNK